MAETKTSTKIMTWVLGALMALTVLMGLASFFMGGESIEEEAPARTQTQSPF